jgi:hypothetical protein
MLRRKIIECIAVAKKIKDKTSSFLEATRKHECYLKNLNGKNSYLRVNKISIHQDIEQ